MLGAGRKGRQDFRGFRQQDRARASPPASPSAHDSITRPFQAQSQPLAILSAENPRFSRGNARAQDAASFPGRPRPRENVLRAGINPLRGGGNQGEGCPEGSGSSGRLGDFRLRAARAGVAPSTGPAEKGHLGPSCPPRRGANVTSPQPLSAGARLRQVSGSRGHCTVLPGRTARGPGPPPRASAFSGLRSPSEERAAAAQRPAPAPDPDPDSRPPPTRPCACAARRLVGNLGEREEARARCG